MAKYKNVRGSNSARRFGREPRVHTARNGYPNDSASICGATGYGSPTNDPVDCKWCLDIAKGKRRPK